MKRKNKKELNPCEEKALVHLQALQIKEKEQKARRRAKKRKIDTTGTLTGQNLPYIAETPSERESVPFFPRSTPTPARDEWDQLIPAAVQTAQFMIFNHAMNRQGQWGQAPQPRREVMQQQQPQAPIIPSQPSEIEMADLSAPQRRLIGQRRGPIRAGVGAPTGIINTARNVGSWFGRGALAVGRGAYSGLSYLGTGAARVATSVGGLMDEIKIQNQLRKNRKLVKMYTEELELDNLKRNLANLTVPNNDPNVIHNKINDKVDIIDEAKDQKVDIIEEQKQPPPLPPKKIQKQSSSIEMQNVSAANFQTPTKTTLSVSSMGGKSPYVKIVTDDFKSKRFAAGNESNTTAYLYKKDQAYRKNIYDKSKGLPSMKTPRLGSDEFAKVDDNWALDKSGNLVSRLDYQTIHPEQSVDISDYKQSGFVYDSDTGNIKTPVRISKNLTNQQVLNYFQDPDNIQAVQNWLKQGNNPRITSHHFLDDDGNVGDIFENTSQYFDPNAENEYFAKKYQEFQEQNEQNIIVEEPGVSTTMFEEE